MLASHFQAPPASIAAQEPNISTDGTIDPCLITQTSGEGTELYDGLDRLFAEVTNQGCPELSTANEPIADPGYFGPIYLDHENTVDRPTAHRSTHEHEAGPACDPLYDISSPQDITKYYDLIVEWDAPEPEITWQSFWTATMRYAAGICAAISTLWNTCYYDSSWHSEILMTPGWKRYSLSRLNKPFYQANGTGDRSFLGSEARLDALLVRLSGTAKAIDDVQTRFIRDLLGQAWYPQEESEVNVMELETSDSCDIGEDDDTQYHKIRETLQAFLHNIYGELDYHKTEPIWNVRLRKDIRAWARIARFRCIKLPCSSMLIYKGKWPLAQRRRRQRRHMQEPYEERFGHNASVSWPISFHDSGHRSGRSSAGYSSGGSSGPGSKKRKLPRDEGGYICDFPGCQKPYDRQCDLTHHQRSHRPKDQLPYPCEHCDQRYGFPKDLRRHEKSHRSKATSEDL